MRHKVIMIREHRPSLQLPAKLFRDGEQATMQDRQSLCAAEVIVLEIRAGGNEISSVL